MRRNVTALQLIPLKGIGEPPRRHLVAGAVVIAVAIHGVIIWHVANTTTPQPILLPKQRIEVNLVAPRPPGARPAPGVTPPTPPKAAPKPPPPVAPPPQRRPVAPQRAAIPVAKPVEPVTPSTPIVTPDPLVEPVKSAMEPPPAVVARPQLVPEPKSEPISPPGFAAAYLKNPKPLYPAAARRMGLEGLVMLRVKVDPEGKPQEVQVVTSSGSPILDKSATDMVLRQWIFVPARQGERAVGGVVDVPIRFSLR